MTDDKVRALRNKTVWYSVLLVAGIGPAYFMFRVLIPLMVNERDDTLLAVAVLAAIVTVLTMIFLSFEVFISARKYVKFINSATKEPTK